jgi:hypothetical protein
LTATAGAPVDPLLSIGTVSGFLLVARHLYVIVAVLALLALCVGLGVGVLRGARLSFPSSLETLTFAVPVGVGVLGTGLFAVGAVGLLDGYGIAAVMGAGVAATYADLTRLPGLIRKCGSELRVVGGWASLITVAFVLLVLTQALAPASDWDSLMYHLDVPADFLRARRIVVPPDNLHVAQVGLIHMLYVPLLAFAGASAPAVMSAMLLFILALAVYACSLRLLERGSADFVLATFWGTATLVLVGPSARVDVALAYLLLAANYALLLAPVSASPARMIGLAGLILGLAIGTKLQALAFAAALVPLAWAAARKALASAGARRSALGWFAAGAALGAAPWLLKNLVLLGAPLYPLLAAKRLEPWLVALLGSAAIPVGVDPRALAALEHARAPFNLWDLAVAPGRLTPEVEGRQYFQNLVIAAVPIALIRLKQWPIVGLLVPALLYLLALLVYTQHVNLRYLLPSLVPLAVVGAAGVYAVARRVFAPSRLRLATGLIAVLIVTPTLLVLGARVSGSGALYHAVGLRSSADYARLGKDPDFRAYMRTVEELNHTVPPSGRVLMLFEARGLYVGVPALQDNLLTNWPIINAAGLGAACLRQTGITHVLVGTGALRFYTTRGLDPALLGWDRFPDFAGRCLRTIRQDENFVLYAVRPDH